MNKLITKIPVGNIAIAFVIAIFFIVDRCLKNLALVNQGPQKLLGDFFTFSFTPNYFIAFSLPIGGKLLEILICLLIILMVAFIYYLMIKKDRMILFFGTVAVFLGTISNFIDRLGYGYVIDYLYLKYFTVFNIADFLIVSGAVLIFFSLNNKTSS